MPLRPCPTCGAICPDGQCPRHPRTRGGYRPHRPHLRAYRTSAYRALRLATLYAADWTCAYCGDHATTADHVTPISKGGHTEMANLVAACHTCNTSKGARTLSEWIASGLAPAPARELCHQRRRDGLPT